LRKSPKPARRQSVKQDYYQNIFQNFSILEILWLFESPEYKEIAALQQLVHDCHVHARERILVFGQAHGHREGEALKALVPWILKI